MSNTLKRYKRKRDFLASLVQDAVQVEEYRSEDYGDSPFEGREIVQNQSLKTLVRLLEETDAILVLGRMLEESKGVASE